MNTNNLTIGQEFKNYPEICIYLSEKQVGGKSKELQQKDWLRYFKYRRLKHKYIIEDVYSDPREKSDGRKKSNSNNRVYGELLEVILLHYLMAKSFERTSLFHIYNEMGITEMNSVNYRYLVQQVEEQYDTKIDKDAIKEFFSFSKIAFGSALNSALRSLEGQGIVKYDIKDIANCGSNGNESTREATSEEVRTEKEISQRILHEMGFRNMSSVYWADRLDEFRRRMMYALRKEVGINYIYKGYDIELIQGRSANFSCDAEDCVGRARKLFAEHFVMNAKKRQQRLLERYFLPTEIYSFRAREPYINDYERLANYFFKI